MTDKIVHMFVYGTLKAGRTLDRPSFSERRTEVKEATIKGSLYNLGWFPGIKLDDTGIVHGEVHKFGEEDIDMIIAAMDRIEGYSEKRADDENLYNRRVVEATTGDGEKVKAFAYEFGRDINKRAEKIESGLWEPVEE